MICTYRIKTLIKVFGQTPPK